MQLRFEPPLFELLAPVNAIRREGESSFRAGERELTRCALFHAQGINRRAAELLGVTVEELEDVVDAHGLRPLRIVS